MVTIIFPFILKPLDVMRSYEARVRILEEEVKSVEAEKQNSDMERTTAYKEVRVSKLIRIEHGKSRGKMFMNECNNYTAFHAKNAIEKTAANTIIEIYMRNRKVECNTIKLL